MLWKTTSKEDRKPKFWGWLLSYKKNQNCWGKYVSFPPNFPPCDYTGCIKKLFPLCFLSISQLPIIRKIKFIIFFKSPFNGQFKNVQNFISRRKTHREIQQNILWIWNKNEQIWPLITSYFLTLCSPCQPFVPEIISIISMRGSRSYGMVWVTVFSTIHKHVISKAYIVCFL